jgi:circadian clock protein KaiB
MMAAESAPRRDHARLGAAEQYLLTLFVSGAAGPSAQAIDHVREICDTWLPGRYSLKVMDLHQDPALGAKHRVLATPTVVKDYPLPSRMVVGNMSDHLRILSELEIDASASVQP